MSGAPVDRKNRWIGIGVILLAALVAVAPQLIRGTSCGHDFDFHLASWFDALASWRHGIAYPRWAPSANYGAGEPRFIFYPPLSWMLGAALGVVLPWKLVPIALTFLCLAGCGLATRALARQGLGEGASTLAGCAALFSGYALFTTYERTDFAELTGGFWIALVLHFALREREPQARLTHRAFDGSAAPLVLAVAGAWLSNAPLGVMASYLLAAVAAVAALTSRSWAPVLRAAASVTIGLGLAAIYLVPAAFEQRWIDLHQILGDPASQVENSWLFARHADPTLALHDVALFKVSIIAVVMLAVAFTSLAVCWRLGKLRGAAHFWLPLAIIPLFVLFLQFPVSDFLWNALPKLRYLEFPWRWLLVLQAPMGIFFAAALWSSRPTRRAITITASALLFLASTIFAGRVFFQFCDDQDAVWAMLDTYRQGQGFVGTDEYEPPWADNSVLAQDLPPSCLTASPTAPLGKLNEFQMYDWAPSQHSCDAAFDAAPNSVPDSTSEHLHIDANAPRAGFLVLRLRSYPAWAVRVDGVLQQNLPQRDDGLIVVPVPQGPSRITADWTTTPDVWAGRALTALALALLAGLFAFERRQTRSKL
ncbi:MAG TPA: hypothetical protein VE291_00740 [Terracidiphilus sp.]|nr:hypothetical protein [Terracidiphilus sp.]